MSRSLWRFFNGLIAYLSLTAFFIYSIPGQPPICGGFYFVDGIEELIGFGKEFPNALAAIEGNENSAFGVFTENSIRLAGLLLFVSWLMSWITLSFLFSLFVLHVDSTGAGRRVTKPSGS